MQKASDKFYKSAKQWDTPLDALLPSIEAAALPDSPVWRHYNARMAAEKRRRQKRADQARRKAEARSPATAPAVNPFTGMDKIADPAEWSKEYLRRYEAGLFGLGREMAQKKIKLTQFEQDRKSKLLREGAKCFYCEVVLTIETFTFDHFVPRSKGGSGEKDKVPACFRCNQEKSDSMDWVQGCRKKTNE